MHRDSDYDSDSDDKRHKKDGSDNSSSSNNDSSSSSSDSDAEQRLRPRNKNNKNNASRTKNSNRDKDQPVEKNKSRSQSNSKSSSSQKSKFLPKEKLGCLISHATVLDHMKSLEVKASLIFKYFLLNNSTEGRKTALLCFVDWQDAKMLKEAVQDKNKLPLIKKNDLTSEVLNLIIQKINAKVSENKRKQNQIILCPIAISDENQPISVEKTKRNISYINEIRQAGYDIHGLIDGDFLLGFPDIDTPTKRWYKCNDIGHAIPDPKDARFLLSKNEYTQDALTELLLRQTLDGYLPSNAKIKKPKESASLPEAYILNKRLHQARKYGDEFLFEKTQKVIRNYCEPEDSAAPLDAAEYKDCLSLKFQQTPAPSREKSDKVSPKVQAPPTITNKELKARHAPASSSSSPVNNWSDDEEPTLTPPLLSPNSRNEQLSQNVVKPNEADDAKKPINKKPTPEEIEKAALEFANKKENKLCCIYMIAVVAAILSKKASVIATSDEEKFHYDQALNMWKQYQQNTIEKAKFWSSQIPDLRIEASIRLSIFQEPSQQPNNEQLQNEVSSLALMKEYGL